MVDGKKMDESLFETLANATLERFMDTIDEVLGDDMDVDLESGILKIEIDNGGQYVINKHAPNRQIWLSSPVSGAAHFEYDATREQWISTRGTETLAGLLAAELQAATGTAVVLD